MKYSDKKIRCKWCPSNNELYIKYHDEEWGNYRVDDHHLFEMLILESFHAGLSWECVLKKRDYFREAYDNFELEKVIKFDEKKQEELRSNANIIRNKLKIKASVNNAIIFKALIDEHGSFYNYLKKFIGDKVMYEEGKTHSEISDNISKDLFKRGMRFVGTVIIYSYLQAVGIINSHEKECFLYKK